MTIVNFIIMNFTIAISFFASYHAKNFLSSINSKNTENKKGPFDCRVRKMIGKKINFHENLEKEMNDLMRYSPSFFFHGKVLLLTELDSMENRKNDRASHQITRHIFQLLLKIKYVFDHFPTLQSNPTD